MELEKIDPHGSEKYLDKWKESELNLSKINSQLLRDYVSDMEQGLNTSGSKKGARSTIKLLAIARQMQRILSLCEEHFKLKDIRSITDKQLHKLFSDMTTGKIKRIDGKPYKSVGDYAARFKAFWHWYMKVQKKEGKAVLDITEDLEASKKKKPEFVYFTKEDLDKMISISRYDLRAVMLFLFDTGIRAPTELMNIRVCDFMNNFKELNIRDETSKTFGRKIKLMMCSDAMKKYIEDNGLKEDDLVFTTEPATLNKQLKKIGGEVLGTKMTIGRKKGEQLTMYDFRHSSACFWLPRYKSISALLFRFGWKKEEEIHYYTQLLGMTDTISENDMLLNADKSQLEKELHDLREWKKEVDHFIKAMSGNEQYIEYSDEKGRDAKIRVPK